MAEKFNGKKKEKKTNVNILKFPKEGPEKGRRRKRR